MYYEMTNKKWDFVSVSNNPNKFRPFMIIEQWRIKTVSVKKNLRAMSSVTVLILQNPALINVTEKNNIWRDLWQFGNFVNM